MVWRLRASLQDRSGGLVRLATACGDAGVNILALDVLPSLDGQVTDELVLHTPTAWAEDDVRAMCRDAGIAEVELKPCSVHAVEDVPVRYLRAVSDLLSDPESGAQRLPDLLCRLLDADTADGSDLPERMTLDDGAGPTVRLARPHRFTDTEWARAGELRRIAAAVQSLPRAQSPSPLPGPAVAHDLLASVSLREGSLADLDAVRLMHARCSAETLRRRYHSAFGVLTPRLARAVLEPQEGFSLLLCIRDEGREHVIGMGMVVVRDDVAEAALIVEDRWQRHGLGSRLVRDLASRAAGTGVGELTLFAQPDNRVAVARTIARAALTSRHDTVDGLSRFRIPVHNLLARNGKRGGQPAIGAITAPLVTLLHRRGELRDAVAAADLIDSAIRDGA